MRVLCMSGGGVCARHLGPLRCLTPTYGMALHQEAFVFFVVCVSLFERTRVRSFSFRIKYCLSCENWLNLLFSKRSGTSQIIALKGKSNVFGFVVFSLCKS